MRPRKTPESNAVYTLPGGNEDNDLFMERGMHEGQPFTISEWEFTPSEREAIMIGGRVQLIMHTHVVPPLAMCAVIRASNGDLTIVEGADQTFGSALLLPAQAERLRGYLKQSIDLLTLQLDQHESDSEAAQAIRNSIADFQDLLHELRPLEERS